MPASDQRQRGRLLRRHPRPGRRRDRTAGRGFPRPAVRGLGGGHRAGPARRCPGGAGPHRAGAVAVGRDAGPAAGRCSRSGWAPGWATAASTCRGSASRTRCARCCSRSSTTTLSGPVNLTGPAPVTNAEFTAALGRAVNRPTPLMVPGFALRALLGEFADEGLLGGQRAIPAALERAGFEFHHNTIGEALAYATAPKDTYPSTVEQVSMSIRSASRADRRAAPGHRRLPERLAAAARAGRRAGRRRAGHPAAARASAGLHRGPAHRCPRSGRSTAPRSSTPTAAARSPGTAPASWSAIRSSDWPNRWTW